MYLRPRTSPLAHQHEEGVKEGRGWAGVHGLDVVCGQYSHYPVHGQLVALTGCQAGDDVVGDLAVNCSPQHMLTHFCQHVTPTKEISDVIPFRGSFN